MMQDFKRIHWIFLYVIVGLLFFGILFFNCKQKISLIVQKRNIEKNMLDAIERSKQNFLNKTFNQQSLSLQVDDALSETSSSLAYITHLFESQGVAISRMHLLKIKKIAGINVLPIKIDVSGNFLAWVQLLALLASSAQPVLLNDFSVQIDRNGGVIVNIQLWLFSMKYHPIKVVYQPPKRLNDDELLSTASLKKMQWGGFLRYENTIYGLLMLPSGKTLMVCAGSKIGVEKGYVIKVTENGIRAQLKNQQINIPNA